MVVGGGGGWVVVFRGQTQIPMLLVRWCLSGRNYVVGEGGTRANTDKDVSI